MLPTSEIEKYTRECKEIYLLFFIQPYLFLIKPIKNKTQSSLADEFSKFSF